jgi:KaiC/GvpD/RAD55 family RecA-like ATPase
MSYDRANELLALIAELGEDAEPKNGHAVSPVSAVQSYDSPRAVIERAAKYLSKVPIAVEGSNGSADCFKAACICRKGFCLSVEDSLEAMAEWNANCQPLWTEYELRHKLEDAGKASGPTGYLLKTQESNWPKVTVPEYKEPKPPTKKPPTEKPRPKRMTLHDTVKMSIEHSATGKKNLIDLGIPDLNYAIGGGAEFGEMIMVAARPSHGKSALALQMISKLTDDGIECAFFSEEMTPLTVGKRVLQFVTPVKEKDWFVNRDKIESDTNQHFTERAECHVVVDCKTTERIAEEVRALAAAGVKAVIVDYVQLLQSAGSRYETVTTNSVILRKVCSETGVLMIVLAQMSRSFEGRESAIPKTSDLKESGQLEQDADVLLFLVWPWKMNPEKDKKEYQIHVLKNRNREIVTHMVRCTFDGARQMIAGANTQSGAYDWIDKLN